MKTQINNNKSGKHRAAATDASMHVRTTASEGW